MTLGEFPITYAVKHRDYKIRMSSRSGGVFTALSDYVLSSGGVVYGAVLNDKLETLHFRAHCKNERDMMRGSKYVQSNMGDIFKSVKSDLDSGILVLFSGTLCQIDGIKAFLGMKYDNLLLVDILCHGVPSPKVWKKYLEWMETLHGKCFEVEFRNKKDFGWAEHVETLDFQNNKVPKRVDSRIYTTIFYSHNALRPSCYLCPYKDILHPGDITIADFWKIDKACPGFNDNKGVSLVFINNVKGLNVFKEVTCDLEASETLLKDSVRPSMFTLFSQPDTRDGFWKDFNYRDFKMIARKYGGYGLLNSIKGKVSHILNQRIVH